MSLTLWFVPPHKNKGKTLWSITRDKNGVWFCFLLTREEYRMTLSENSHCNVLRIPNPLQWPCCTASLCSWPTALMWAAEVPGLCSTPLSRAGSCTHSDLCLRDSFEELSVAGLTWIIKHLLPCLLLGFEFIATELFLKDATDPLQQLNPKLWQKHWVSTATLSSIIPMTYPWMTRMPNGQNRPNSSFSGCLYMQHTQYHSINWFFLIK